MEETQLFPGKWVSLFGQRSQGAAAAGGTLEPSRGPGSWRLSAWPRAGVQEDSAHCDRLHVRVKENVSPISQRRKPRPRKATWGLRQGHRAHGWRSPNAGSIPQDRCPHTAWLHLLSCICGKASLISASESPFPSLCMFLPQQHTANLLSLCLQLPIPGPLCFPLDLTRLFLRPSLESAGEWPLSAWPFPSISIPASPSPSHSWCPSYLDNICNISGLRPGLCDSASLGLFDELCLCLSLSGTYFCVFRTVFFKLCIMTIGHKINELDCDQQLNKQAKKKKKTRMCSHTILWTVWAFYMTRFQCKMFSL